MNASPDARADDREPDGFVYIHTVAYTWGTPCMDPAHSNFFSCYPLSDDDAHKPPRFGGGPHPPVAVQKNIYNLTAVFPIRASLVVNAVLHEALRRLCEFESREVRIERAFYFPYALGDQSYEKAIPSGDDEPMSSYMGKFADRYACDPPAEPFYQVIEPCAELIQSDYPDCVKFRTDDVKDTSIYARNILVSRSMLARFGLVFSNGWICRPDVFNILNPYLHRPWFWAKNYRFPDSERATKA